MATMNPTSDADALRLIQDTAVKAAGGASRIVSLPGEPAGVYGVLKSDGTIEKRFATKKARTHYLLSIGEISSALEHYKALSVDRVMSPVVWYHEEMVRVVLDDGTVLPFGD